MARRYFGFSMERTTTQKHWNMSAMHAHQDYELYFLISGQRRYFLGHTIYDVAPCNVVFIPRTMLHRTVALGNKGFDRYVINFSQEHYDTFVRMTGRDPFAPYPKGACLQLPPDKTRLLMKCFEQMEQALNEAGEWAQGASATLFYEILLDCFRFGKPKQPCQEETADKIQQAARYISEHYADLLTLEDAAGLVHMEKTYFSKRFKALTGFGFLDYLTQTRLRAAEDLLTRTSLSIGDISDTCGFSGSNYFGDVFRRYHGISPSEYRIRSGSPEL